MKYDYECDYCHATLDPSEQCDCPGARRSRGLCDDEEEEQDDEA